MNNEEKYKLALFLVIRNNSVLPKEIALNKTGKEINKMTIDTMGAVMDMIDYDLAKEMYLEGLDVE